MREWLCTSKAEMTRQAETRSWDDTTVNVWHKLAACDHLLDTDSWKHGDPPQGQGISLATATRHLRILRRRIEEIMGTSARHQDTHRIWRTSRKNNGNYCGREKRLYVDTTLFYGHLDTKR
jgi:hypothetical protein